MRRSIFVITMIFMLLWSGVCYAADALYRMLHADEVESFQKDQSAFIVGKIIDKQDKFFSVQVLKVLSGGVKSDYILVADDFKYGWSDRSNLPSVGDFCVMSLKKTGSTYKRAWGIFKADGGDYKTLRLTEANAPSSGMNGDLAAIQWYVNSGGKEKEFLFEGGNVYVRRPNGEVIKIFPRSGDVAPGREDTFNEDLNTIKSDVSDSNKNQLTPSLKAWFIGVIVLLTAVFLFLRKKRPSK